MSIHSKAKRDLRRKKLARPGAARSSTAITAQAHLLDEDDAVIGGAGQRGDAWGVIFGGKVVANTDSAGMVIAMLKHIVALHAQNGQTLRLDYSAALAGAATLEAESHGKTLDDYLDMLEAERRERLEQKAI